MRLEAVDKFADRRDQVRVDAFLDDIPTSRPAKLRLVQRDRAVGSTA